MTSCLVYALYGLPPAEIKLMEERQGRILPRELKPYPRQVDDPIGSKFA